jgi:serine/threonine-protein kinase
MAAMLTDADYAAQRVGRTLCNKYTLDSLIGVGGMAAVYKGIHRNGHRVAIKMLHPAVSASEQLRTRFLREGYAANAVDHPGAVRVLDDDVADDGSVFLVMELLSGTTLTSLWETMGGRLPLDQTARLMHQLLDVLAAAHVKGIVHRDIKPDNLWVSPDGRLRVLDFGIARMRDSMGSSATRTGGIMGTPAFMPREQALGLVKEIDGRTDIWAVGATMFTLISGRTVHVAETPEGVIVQTATVPAPPFASVVPGVPASIAAVVDQALAFDMSARFPDARAMQGALEQAFYAAFGQPLAMMPSYGGAVPGAGQTVQAPMSQLAGTPQPVFAQTPQPLLAPTPKPAFSTPGGPVSTTDGVASGQTGASAGATGSTSRGSNKGAAIAAGVVVAVLAASGVFFLQRGHGRSPDAAPSAAAAPAAPSAEAHAAPSAPPPPALPAPAATASTDDHLAAPSAEEPPAPAPSAAPSAKAHAPVVAPQHTQAVAPAPAPKPVAPAPVAPAPAAAPTVNCDPPWYIDPVTHGRKVKPGC